jgi:hypothetical protein
MTVTLAGIVPRAAQIACIRCGAHLIGQTFCVHNDKEPSIVLAYRYPLCRPCVEIEAPSAFLNSNGVAPTYAEKSMTVDASVVFAMGLGFMAYLHKGRRVANPYRAYHNGREMLLRGFLAWLPDGEA